MVLYIEKNSKAIHWTTILNLLKKVNRHNFKIHSANPIKLETMSSIPQGAFCVMKMTEKQAKLPVAVMKNAESHQSFKKYFEAKLTDLAPLKYNSKLMNSIWGIYNRYSPHNIKKTNDDVSPAYGDLQKQNASFQNIPISLELGEGLKNNKLSNQKRENIWTNIPISQSH